MAPNGYIHAGAIVTLADTCCGYGCMASLPDGAMGFTTIELKTNFLSSAREGTLQCVATARHLGKTTQIWDAAVTHKEIRQDAGALPLHPDGPLLTGPVSEAGSAGLR